MNAHERALELMNLPMGAVPEIAKQYARHLANRVGMCMEVFITAYSVYAQIVEKLPCNDNLYTPDDEAIRFFKSHGYEYDRSHKHSVEVLDINHITIEEAR